MTKTPIEGPVDEPKKKGGPQPKSIRIGPSRFCERGEHVMNQGRCVMCGIFNSVGLMRPKGYKWPKDAE